MSCARPPFPFVLAAVGLLGAACSSSTTDPAPAPALSASEAASVGFALNARTFTGVIGQAGPTPNNTTGSVSVPCAQGGSVGVAYTVVGARDSTRAGVIAATTTLTPQRCVESTGSRTVTIDGDPSVQSTLTVTFVPNDTVVEATVAGHVVGAVKLDGARCALDYTVSSTFDAGTTVAGTVCGQAINITR